MLLELAQTLDAAKPGGGEGTATLISLGVLIVSSAGLWLDKILAYRKVSAQEKQAEADEAEARAKAKASPAANGAGVHEKYILPHSLKLQELEGRVKTMDAGFEKLEKENSAQHGRIFDKLDDIKDLVIGKSSRTA